MAVAKCNHLPVKTLTVVQTVGRVLTPLPRPSLSPSTSTHSTNISKACLQDFSLITMQRAPCKQPCCIFFSFSHATAATHLLPPWGYQLLADAHPAQASWSYPAPHPPHTCHTPHLPRPAVTTSPAPVTSEGIGGTSCLYCGFRPQTHQVYR